MTECRPWWQAVLLIAFAVVACTVFLGPVGLACSTALVLAATLRDRWAT